MTDPQEPNAWFAELGAGGPVAEVPGGSVRASLIAGLAPRALAAAQHLRQIDTLTDTEAAILLADVHSLAVAVETLEEDLLLAARRAGATWQSLALALDLNHRQSASDRHARVLEAHSQGRTVRELTEERVSTRRKPGTAGTTTEGNSEMGIRKTNHKGTKITQTYGSGNVIGNLIGVHHGTLSASDDDGKCWNCRSAEATTGNWCQPCHDKLEAQYG